MLLLKKPNTTGSRWPSWGKNTATTLTTPKADSTSTVYSKDESTAAVLPFMMVTQSNFMNN